MPATEAIIRPCLEKNEIWDNNLNWEEHDKLGRKHLADKLERLVANSPGPYVIGLTSEWGSGKTLFLQCWKNDLQQRKIPCVYFNAWETDHASEPLLAILGCIKNTLVTNEYLAEDTSKKICGYGKKILKKSPTMIFKAALGVINRATDGAIGDELKDIIVEMGECSVDEFLNIEKARDDFVKELENIAASVRQHASNSSKYPLLVIIDELDRCRPDYAISLLECIKHLFHVPNVIFVLSFDGEQLCSVIEHTFGLKNMTEQKSNEPAPRGDLRQIYLCKFIDMFYKLPEPDKELFVFNFLSKNAVPLPHDWEKIDKEVGMIHDTTLEKLLGANSFYYVLATTIRDSKKSLRDCIQALSKFVAISRVYSLSWRESFWIFDMLMQQVSKMHQPEISTFISTATFKKRVLSLENRTLNTEDIPKMFKDNFLSFLCYEQFRYGNDMDNALTTIYKNLDTPFNGEELIASVKEKFDFGRDFDTDLH